MLQNQIKLEQAFLMKKIEKLKLQIAALPEGDIIYSRNGPYTKYGLRHKGKSQHLSSKQHSLIEQLSLKRYYSIQLSAMEAELQQIEKFLKNFIPYNERITQEVCSCYGLSNLISFSNQAVIQKWLAEPYQTNKRHPERLIFKSRSGILMRSKSEVIIADTLLTYKIPFRYECSLDLNGVIVYPDFTILHPETMETYYWEHFGLMEKASYREQVFQKLELYGNHNILPSINLITTYETQLHPINSESIQQIIENAFL